MCGPRCHSLTTAVKISHMSTTRQIKRTQMVATPSFAIRVFVMF